MTFVFKLQKVNDATAIPADFDARPSWGNLASRIASMFSISLNNVAVIFIDDTQGRFTIKNEEDLQSFYQVFDPSSGTIKFVVQDQTPDSPATISAASSKADDQLRLFCWVINVSYNPFHVIIGKSLTVCELSEEIKKKKERTFGAIDSDALNIWKLSPPIPSTEIATKLRDAQSPQQIQGCVKLDPLDELSEHFFPAIRKHLHIIVEAPPIRKHSRNFSTCFSNEDEPPTKRQRQSEVIVEKNVIAFWRQLWIDGKNLIRHETIQRDSDCLEDVDVPATFDVLHGLPVSFTKGGILIRSEYKSAEEGIESHRPHANAVVIVGHPGIGKSSFLLYLLARRLLARKPTIFQRDARSIYFFSATGVRRLSGDIDDESVKSSETWVLIDAKAKHETPPIFTIDRSDLFLVIASSPRPSHWRDVQHYRPPVKIWLMEPFGLEELIQARQLQQTRCSETSIRQFLQEYGPSARDCYAFCESIPFYHAHHIHDRVKNIAWDTITDMLRARKDVIGMDDGSHKLILVRPSPTDRSSPSMSIITKTVARLLHERDSVAECTKSVQNTPS